MAISDVRYIEHTAIGNIVKYKTVTIVLSLRKDTVAPVRGSPFSSDTVPEIFITEAFSFVLSGDPAVSAAYDRPVMADKMKSVTKTIE